MALADYFLFICTTSSTTGINASLIADAFLGSSERLLFASVSRKLLPLVDFLLELVDGTRSGKKGPRWWKQEAVELRVGHFNWRGEQALNMCVMFWVSRNPKCTVSGKVGLSNMYVRSDKGEVTLWITSLGGHKVQLWWKHFGNRIVTKVQTQITQLCFMTSPAKTITDMTHYPTIQTKLKEFV